MVKKSIYFFIVFKIFSYYSFAQNHQPLSASPYDFDSFRDDTCSNTKCLTLKDLVSFALSHGFETREKAQLLFQARSQIKESLGFILPHMRVNTLFAISERSITESISSFVGFVFPSNWYNWKRAKSMAYSEQESYRTLLANRVQEVETLYFGLNLMLTQKDILNHYFILIDKIVKNIVWQKKNLDREINPEQLGIIYTIRYQIKASILALDLQIKNCLPKLAFAIGYKYDWKTFKIKRQKITKLNPILFPKAKEDMVHEIFKKSSEIKTIDGLIKASKYSKRSEYFNFLHPDSGSNPLGFGYKYRIKIAQSKVLQLEIEKEKIKANLKLAYYMFLNKYEVLLQQVESNYKVRMAMEGPKQAMIDNIYRDKVFFDIEKVIRFFDYTLDADSNINLINHMYAINKSIYQRLFWQSDIYKDLDFLVQEKISKK